MKERGTIKVMKKYMFSLMMVFLMVAGMCIPASATEILPKPLENIPAKMEKANIDFRMDTPVKLFTMKCQNLMLGEIVTTFDNFSKRVYSTDFPHGIATFATNMDTDTTAGEVKVGLCRVASNGDYISDVYGFVTARGSDFIYADTSSMIEGISYWGYIKNTGSKTEVYGTLEVGYLR